MVLTHCKVCMFYCIDKLLLLLNCSNFIECNCNKTFVLVINLLDLIRFVLHSIFNSFIELVMFCYGVFYVTIVMVFLQVICIGSLIHSIFDIQVIDMCFYLQSISYIKKSQMATSLHFLCRLIWGF